MESELIQQAAENGIWVLMFVVLFLYTVLDSRNREKRYESREDKYQETIAGTQVIIAELSKQLCVVDIIQKDVTFIKYTLEKGE